MVTVINSRQNIQVNTSYSLSCDLIHIEFQLYKLFTFWSSTQRSNQCADINDKVSQTCFHSIRSGYMFATSLFVVTSHESNCQH